MSDKNVAAGPPVQSSWRQILLTMPQSGDKAVQRTSWLMYVSLQQPTVVMGCQDSEVSTTLGRGGRWILFIYLIAWFYVFFPKQIVWVCQGMRGMVYKHREREDGQPSLAQDMLQNSLQRCARPLTLVIMILTLKFGFPVALCIF